MNKECVAYTTEAEVYRLLDDLLTLANQVSAKVTDIVRIIQQGR